MAILKKRIAELAQETPREVNSTKPLPAQAKETLREVQCRVPENSPGYFYVAAGECTSCLVPHSVAPGLMNDLGGQRTECFFKRQPQTPEEVEIAIQAMNSSCVQALRYGGTDRKILARLKTMGLEDCCDNFHLVWCRRIRGRVFG